MPSSLQIIRCEPKRVGGGGGGGGEAGYTYDHSLLMLTLMFYLCNTYFNLSFKADYVH